MMQVCPVAVSVCKFACTQLVTHTHILRCTCTEAERERGGGEVWGTLCEAAKHETKRSLGSLFVAWLLYRVASSRIPFCLLVPTYI